MMSDPESWFSPSFAVARTRFRALASTAGGDISTHEVEGVGAEGEALGVDVATFGPKDADRALLTISGTHGAEAYSGSAAQMALIDSLFEAPLPEGIKLVVVHGINPFGFSHRTRSNENNVDLSRNFRDFTRPLPANPAYARYHPICCPDVWDDAAPQRYLSEIGVVAREHGMDVALTGATGGQYDHPLGLNYGGDRRERSNAILEAVCRAELSGCEKLGYLEWHTGFGAYAEPFFVCLHPDGSPELARAERWFGQGTVGRNAEAFGGSGAPAWSGLMWHGLTEQFLPEAQIVGSVVEFGTYGNSEVGTAVMMDRWLRFGTGPDDAALRARLRATVIDRFDPQDPGWRSAVVRHGLRIHREVLAGLAAW